MLEFSRPIWLLLLLAIPALAFVALRLSYASLGPYQKWISLAVRVIVWVLLVFSAAGAQFVRHSDRVSVIVVKDSSDSIDDSQVAQVMSAVETARQTMRKDDSLGKVNFGADAYLEYLPQPGTDERMLQEWQTEPRGNFTDIGEAIQLAVASFPDNAQKRLVLITDGNENVGSALAEGRVARDNDVELFTVPLTTKTGPEVVLDSLEAPERASLGETVDVRFVLNSTVATEADVTLMRNGEFVDKAPLSIKPGKEVYEFPVTIDQSGFFTYELAVEPRQDTVVENNRAYTFSVVQGQPRLLYATGDPAELAYLPRTLITHNIAVDVVPPSGIPYSLEDFQPYDGIIFSDVAAFDISTEQMKMIQVMVRDFGRGFMMLGGDKSFGVGGYFETPIEETLPVDMDFRRKRITPSSLVICLVDKSGSMAATVGGVEKIQMAKEACIEVVKLQGPSDYVGVMGFDDTGQWVVKPEANVDKGAVINTISQMRGGGGTDLYPALKAAFEEAKQIKVQVKHFIIFTDGMVAPGDFEGLAKEMQTENCTMSTVAFGTDADIPFMKELAQLGGGNMYEARNLQDLPRIFTREVFMANKATIDEEPFIPRPTGDSPLLSGIAWGSAPALLGYVATSAKDRAEVPLVTGKEDPLLAVWRYGLGKSAAFTSDAKNRWAANWLGWSGYERFFLGLARWIRSDLDSSNIDVKTSITGRQGVVQVSAVGQDGQFLNKSSFEARITDPELESRNIKLEQVGPGQYEGRFEVAGNGNYFVNVVQLAGDKGAEKAPVGAAAGGLAVSYSPEYRDISPNTFLLSQMQEGSLAPQDVQLEGLFEQGRKPTRRLEDAWELFTLIALILWLLDVAARRLVLDAHEWQQAFAAVIGGTSGRRAQRTRESLAGLLSAKERATGRGAPRGSTGSEGSESWDPSALAEAQRQRSRLDQAADARSRVGAGQPPAARKAGQPEGQITAPPAEQQQRAAQNAGDLSSLRRKLDTLDQRAGPAQPGGFKPLDPQQPARPAETPKPKVDAPMTERDFTSRLLDRKRKKQDDE
ncbi:VWA domain-containing protein [bacterium]|nr:VWA domain-containing protein [bacterium]